jgi:hypothetical protein
LASSQNPLSRGKECLSASWEMWPFKQNGTGGLRKFGLPALMPPGGSADEAYGYCGDLYCPHCGTKSDFMLVEFQKPRPEILDAWMNLDPEEIDEDILRCPRCGRADLEPSGI